MKAAIAFVLALICLGCDDSITLKDNPVPSVIKITAEEICKGNVKTLQLKCETEAVYNCKAIVHEQSFDGSKLLIVFKRLESLNCPATPQAPTPAYATIELGNIPNGVYNIDIYNGVFKNNGTITISNSEAVINIADQNAIEITNQVVPRIEAKGCPS